MGGVNLADDQTLTPIHRRTYDVQAFKRNDTEIVLQGSVQDVKPPGLYIEGDPNSLTIHHMIVTLTVTFPVLMITDATVEFAEHPHLTCPNVVAHYGELIGLSIARGFTHKVRELFGGPRGCTHTTALLQAMAPVAVQCNWSMQLAKIREMGGTCRRSTPSGGSPWPCEMSTPATCGPRMAITSTRSPLARRPHSRSTSPVGWSNSAANPNRGCRRIGDPPRRGCYTSVPLYLGAKVATGHQGVHCGPGDHRFLVEVDVVRVARRGSRQVAIGMNTAKEHHCPGHPLE